MSEAELKDMIRKLESKILHLESKVQQQDPINKQIRARFNLIKNEIVNVKNVLNLD